MSRLALLAVALVAALAFSCSAVEEAKETLRTASAVTSAVTQAEETIAGLEDSRDALLVKPDRTPDEQARLEALIEEIAIERRLVERIKPLAEENAALRTEVQAALSELREGGSRLPVDPVGGGISVLTGVAALVAAVRRIRAVSVEAEQKLREALAERDASRAAQGLAAGATRPEEAARSLAAEAARLADENQRDAHQLRRSYTAPIVPIDRRTPDRVDYPGAATA